MRGRRRVAAAAVVLALLGAALWLSEPALAAPSGGGGAEAAEKRPAKAGEGQGSPKHLTPGPPVLARSWGLSDGRTGEVLIAHAGNRRLPIASTTKLMTAYVAMKDMPLDKIVRAAHYDAEYGESLMGLRTGQRISVRDLLYGLILRSGNDAAHTLALRAAGSVPKFVEQMNRYAAALGLSNTHYANPIGLDQKGNYSSALDLMTLTRHLLAIPAFAKIADSREAELTSVRPRRRIKSINELLEDAPWVTGVKTGHTWGAAYVLVGSGRRHGTELISVAIGAPTDETRFSDNLELLEWGFRQYHHEQAIHRGQALAEPSIRYAGGSLPLRAAQPLEVGLRKGQQLEIEVEAPAQVTGPIRRGARLGRANVFVDSSPAGSVLLRAGRAIPRAAFVDRARYFLGNNWIPIAAAICAILLCGMLLYLRRSRRKRRMTEGENAR
ncbi:MAG: D-alanyl-D-alanine carboxypeptidase [Actinobacteria bacterium]|nr:D-alanyl-D-alanine carboxypeptidase [Actinomycetota bacterium]